MNVMLQQLGRQSIVMMQDDRFGQMSTVQMKRCSCHGFFDTITSNETCRDGCVIWIGLLGSDDMVHYEGVLIVGVLIKGVDIGC